MSTLIKAIVFDVDGVLINCVDDEGCFSWQKSIKEDLGIPAEVVTKGFFLKYWPRIGTGEMDTLEALSEFLNGIGAGISANTFMDYWFEKDSDINQDVYELASHLKEKGYRLFIGTNQEKYRLDHLKNLLNKNDLFEDFFASSIIGYGKPDPLFFKAVIERTGLKPSEMFFIDDSDKNIETARSLQWHAHHFSSIESLKLELQKFI